ncbi:MAG TPA: pyridoxal-phosphate dependent enzyme [Bryobacteraceae bacterium]|nr:pyridoxal-phosphate dependent enzyme [Bryobacteraceae bacterium]
MLSLCDVQQAAARISLMVHRTPVLTSHLFNERAGVETFFKCENFQRAGAFKIRGAANFLLSIPKADLPRGVVAFSSGNHAQAVAMAARDLGTTATIVMPDDAPAAKVEATRNYGAKIVTYDRMREDREAIGRQLAAETGATLVPPFDHEWIMAGQGTAALELLTEQPSVEALVVCIGGGGLLAGCATAAKGLNPNIRVFGVEPEDGNDTYLSWKKGERVRIPPPTTSADGLRAPQPGALTFPMIQDAVEEIVLVSEEEIRETVEFLRSRLKIVVEPSGAVAPAALLFQKIAVRSAGVIVSGGNL